MSKAGSNCTRHSRVQITALRVLLIPNTTANHAITYSFITCVQLSSQQHPDEGLEERSYLKPVKDKLASCTTTGHASIIFKLAYTSACP